MATRQETQQRKQALLDGLRAAYREGRGNSGLALSQRALSEQYQLSVQTVGLQLQQLVQEGVLYTVPRVGTFMGRPPLETMRPYLLLSDFARDRHIFLDQVLTGFEERVAQLGGSSFSLCSRDIGTEDASLGLEVPAGIFDFHHVESWPAGLWENSAVPRAAFGSSPYALADLVDFDDEIGGAQAARHLLEVGHRRIAFLGLHHPSDTPPALAWSALRQRGWERMMRSTGLDVDGLAFHPAKPDPRHQVESLRETVDELLSRSDISAVISVNAFASRALLEGLQGSALPADRWPAIVGFDDTPRGRAAGLTYLRLPWEKIGAEAAQLLWERATGRLEGPPVRRKVGMHLIPRLTSQAQWAQASAPIRQRMLAPVSQSYETVQA